MSKKRLPVVTILAIILAGIVALPPKPGTPKFSCDPDAEHPTSYIMQREEHGMPLSFLKRSVSDFDCQPIGKISMDNDQQSPTVKTFYLLNPDHRHEQYEAGYIIILYALIDIFFWLAIAYFITSLYIQRKKRQ